MCLHLNRTLHLLFACLCFIAALRCPCALPCSTNLEHHSRDDQHVCSATSPHDAVSLLQLVMKSTVREVKTHVHSSTSHISHNGSNSGVQQACGFRLTNQTLAHGWLQNAKYARAHQKLFTEEVGLMKHDMQSWIDDQPFPETESDQTFFVNLSLLDLSRVREILEHVELLLAADSLASISLFRAFDTMAKAASLPTPELNITACDVHNWVLQTNQSLTTFAAVKTDLVGAAKVLNHSSGQGVGLATTIVANKGDFLQGLNAMQRMTSQMDVAAFGFKRLLADSNLLM